MKPTREKTDKKKAMVNQYKQSNIAGGVFLVTNTRNGKYLLDYAVNIKAKRNAFDFMTSSDSFFDYKLKEDLEKFGNKVFTFEVLETIEKKKEQTQEEYIADLKALAQICIEKMDQSLKY